MGHDLDLQRPETYNEKLQWMKLYDHNPNYTRMVDKYLVKEFVAERVGKEYIIPTLGVWDKFVDIDFEQLPNQFVLKCTHDSGGLVIGLCVYSAIQILFYWLYYWPKKMDIDSKKVVFQSFLPYVFVGGCITLGLQLIPHSDNHWLNVILFGGIFALLYLVGIIALLNHDDRQFIMSILKRKSH
jgi:hypothetical protein